MPRPSKHDLGQLYMWREAETFQDYSTDILLLNMYVLAQIKQVWHWPIVGF